MSQSSETGDADVPTDEQLTHAIWQDALRDGTLLGIECADCGHVAGVPKSVCPGCNSRSISPTKLPETGTVYSETTIEVTPEGQDDRYQVAIVDLGETRVLARIDGAVAIGESVKFQGSVEYDGMPGPLFG